MTARPRVLIIDDSVLVRRTLSGFVEKEAGLELAGVAPSAAIGIQKVEQVGPDVVVLDIEMPEMNGIEATVELRRRFPRLPILICSGLTHRGADATLKALAAGASDYVAKPSGLEGGRSPEDFKAEFLAKLRALTGAVSPLAAPTPGPKVERARRPLVARTTPAEVIAIGCSTGGPNALSTIFARWPTRLSVPIVIVQHMPPLFTRMLAERLTTMGTIPVSEARAGDLIRPGHAYIAPGGFHLGFVRDGDGVRAVITDGPPENSCRPAIDVMFRSAAQIWGRGVVGAVLTGMGYDGTRGAEAIVDAGGEMLVQEPSSCVVATMPNSVSAAGLARESLPLEGLVAGLVTAAHRGRSFITGAAR